REGDTDEARRREASLPQRIDAAQRQRGEEEDDDHRRQDREPAENREEQPAEAPEHVGTDVGETDREAPCDACRGIIEGTLEDDFLGPSDVDALEEADEKQQETP